MDLIKNSQKLLKDADHILNESKIIEKVEKFGKVFIVGSYKLDLMYRPDIDIDVQVENYSVSEMRELARDLLKSNYYQKVLFQDWTEIKSPFGKNYIYLGLLHYYNDIPWKIDIHYTNEKISPYLGIFKKIKEGVEKNPEAKLKILELKEKYFRDGEYKDGMTSVKVYEEVLGKL